MTQDLRTYSGKVLKVIEANILDLEMDLGLTISCEIRIRLNGLTCPKKEEPLAAEARQFITDLVLGQWVRLQVFRRDGHGRWFAHLYQGTTSVNKLLVTKGFAQEFLPAKHPES